MILFVLPNVRYILNDKHVSCCVGSSFIDF